MIRAVIQYEAEPDSVRYQQHVEEFAARVDRNAPFTVYFAELA